jgi:hypothetical protein
MADLNLVPHPLVTRVGLGLLRRGEVTFTDEIKLAAEHLDAESTTAAAAAKGAAQQAAEDAAQAARDAANRAEVTADTAQQEADRLAAEAAQATLDAEAAEQRALQESENAEQHPRSTRAQEAALVANQEAAEARAVAAEKATEAEDAAAKARALREAANAARAAAPDAPPEEPNVPVGQGPANPPNPLAAMGSFDPIDVDDLHPEQKDALAAALANKADLPDISLFAGFIGGKISYEGLEWRLVYLDSRLYSWLLVQEKDVLVHQRLADDRAPSGLRDVLWVRGNANLMQGDGARSNEGRFLVGDFTRAGDFAASTTGGTFSAATGLLCEATTPGCCLRPRTRVPSG